MPERLDLSFLDDEFAEPEPGTGRVIGYLGEKPVFGGGGASGRAVRLNFGGVGPGGVQPRITIPEGRSDEEDLFGDLAGELGDLGGGATYEGPPDEVLERARRGESKEGFGDQFGKAVKGVSEWLKNPFGVVGRAKERIAERKARGEFVSREEGDVMVIEERKGFFDWLSGVSQGAKKIWEGVLAKTDVGSERVDNWIQRFGKRKPRESASVSSGERIKAWKPKVTREQVGKFLEIYGVNAISFAMGMVAGAEFGQNAPMALEAAGMTMLAVGQIGLMMGKERGMAEIAETESKFRRVGNAIQRVCSNSAVRTGLRIARSGGLGLAITTMPDVLRHLAGADVAPQAQAGIDQVVNPPVVQPPVEPASGVNLAEQMTDALAQQQTNAQQAAEQTARAAVREGRQGIQDIMRVRQGIQQAAVQQGWADRVAAGRDVINQAAQKAQELRLAAEQWAQQQQTAVDALRAGQTMAEMARSMPQGTAHEAVYEMFRHIPGLQNHVGEAAQALLNGLRAEYGAEQGEQIFRSLPQGAVETMGNKLAEFFRSVPKGGLPYQFGGANNMIHQLLQGANLSLDSSQGLQGARDIFGNIVRPTIGAILP